MFKLLMVRKQQINVLHSATLFFFFFFFSFKKSNDAHERKNAILAIKCNHYILCV